MTSNKRVEEVNTLFMFAELKQKFHEAAAESYPETGQPEMCWLFDQVLGIDPRMIAAQPITKKKYYVFLPADTEHPYQRLMNPSTQTPYRVTRYFTPDQRKKLNEWWLLLPDEMKA